jgi:hypothetical protein
MGFKYTFKKTSLDGDSVNTQQVLVNTIQKVDGNLVYNDPELGQVPFTIDAGSINIDTYNWQKEDITPPLVAIRPFVFVLSSMIKKLNNQYQIRILFNGIEVSASEFTIGLDHKTITLTLVKNMQVRPTDSVVVWYVKV